MGGVGTVMYDLFVVIHNKTRRRLLKHALRLMLGFLGPLFPLLDKILMMESFITGGYFVTAIKS
jgi:hypothetical protein